MSTQSKEIVDYEYRAINIGLNGVFVNRGAGNGKMLVAETQPDANNEGDPMFSGKRYLYELSVGKLVWAKTNKGNARVGVTPS